MNTDEALMFSDDQLDRLADLLAIKLKQTKPTAPAMLTVEDLSATYQVSRAWIYENAARLGGVKLGPGRRAPLRFDARKVDAAMSPLGRPDPEQPALQPQSPHRRTRTTELLPVYDG
jgi:hypothetical protein